MSNHGILRPQGATKCYYGERNGKNHMSVLIVNIEEFALPCNGIDWCLWDDSFQWFHGATVDFGFVAYCGGADCLSEEAATECLQSASYLFEYASQEYQILRTWVRGVEWNDRGRQ